MPTGTIQNPVLGQQLLDPIDEMFGLHPGFRLAQARVDVFGHNGIVRGRRHRDGSIGFAAGVADNIEVVQAQKELASADESLISSLYAYNLSKIALERAIGNAEAGVQEYLKGR